MRADGRICFHREDQHQHDERSRQTNLPLRHKVQLLHVTCVHSCMCGQQNFGSSHACVLLLRYKWSNVPALLFISGLEHMSEELGYTHAAAGRPVEPIQPAGIEADSSGINAASATSPPRRSPRGHPPSAAVSSGKRTFVPGGGSALVAGDKPGDPFATLLVLPADGFVGRAPPRAGGSTLPKPLDEALGAMLDLVEKSPRSVAVVAGGDITSSLMTQMVLRMPGGLDSFGPGRRVHALLKERSAPWGHLWESALLVKALAKRQAATVRFGCIVVLSAPCLAAQTLRAYKHVFSDCAPSQSLCLSIHRPLNPSASPRALASSAACIACSPS